jgi:hypothetical protein
MKAKGTRNQESGIAPVRDPFDAVPVRAENAEARFDASALAQIRMRIQPGKSIASRLRAKLGMHREIRVDLDQYGSRYWAMIDGRRSLGEIERHIREEFSLKPEQSRQATLHFTKMLMMRHLVFLDLRPAGERTEPAPREEAAHAR